MRIEHQIRAFEQIFSAYDGLQPLHRFLFTYFKKHKQMGSSDRRWATRYIYSFFRLGKALVKENNLQRLAIADFLCNPTPSLMVETYLPNLVAEIGDTTTNKIKAISKAYPLFNLQDVFYCNTYLSDEVDKLPFYTSFFIQPDLFIRVKPENLMQLTKQLELAAINVKQVTETTLALPIGTKLEQVFTNNEYYQIQDYSSQKTGAYFKPNPYNYWWDCCAASGGKSLLLHNLEPKIELLVSDIRENSLENLKERFQLAGIKKYQLKVIDLLQNNDQILHDYEFDGILLDAPCTGSGTWARTPEMLCYFEKHKIENYVKLQKAIAANVIKYLKKDCPLVYMTCSVFKAENEDIVAYLVANFPLKLEKMELIKGFNNKADSLFVARLIKQ
jgi:16S rRNA (cytosine967-C5)-methyltransferase